MCTVLYCTVLLPPAVNPIAVKYIVYNIISYYIVSLYISYRIPYTKWQKLVRLLAAGVIVYTTPG